MHIIFSSFLAFFFSFLLHIVPKEKRFACLFFLVFLPVNWGGGT